MCRMSARIQTGRQGLVSESICNGFAAGHGDPGFNETLFHNPLQAAPQLGKRRGRGCEDPTFARCPDGWCVNFSPNV